MSEKIKTEFPIFSSSNKNSCFCTQQLVLFYRTSKLFVKIFKSHDLSRYFPFGRMFFFPPPLSEEEEEKIKI